MSEHCGHTGRIEKDLACPDPACGAGQVGSKLIVPVTRRTAQGWEHHEREYTRAQVVDQRLPGGGYWRWDGPALRHHEEHHA